MDEPDRPIEKFILPADLPAYLYHFLEYFIGQSQHLPDTNIPDLSKFWHEHRFSFHPDSYEPSLRVHVKRLFTIIFLATNYSTAPTIQIQPHKIYKKQKNNRVIQTFLSRIFFHFVQHRSSVFPSRQKLFLRPKREQEKQGNRGITIVVSSRNFRN